MERKKTIIYNHRYPYLATHNPMQYMSVNVTHKLHNMKILTDQHYITLNPDLIWLNDQRVANQISLIHPEYFLDMEHDNNNTQMPIVDHTNFVMPTAACADALQLYGFKYMKLFDKIPNILVGGSVVSHVALISNLSLDAYIEENDISDNITFGDLLVSTFDVYFTQFDPSLSNTIIDLLKLSIANDPYTSQESDIRVMCINAELHNTIYRIRFYRELPLSNVRHAVHIDVHMAAQRTISGIFMRQSHNAACILWDPNNNNWHFAKRTMPYLFECKLIIMYHMCSEAHNAIQKNYTTILCGARAINFHIKL